MNLIYTFFFIAYIITTGCAPLPKYATPHIVTEGNFTKTGEEVTYRNLTIEDFKASELPDYRRAYSNRLHAHTSVRIRPSSRTKFNIGSNFAFNQKVYYGKVKNLEFEAVMLPEHSWWNPKVPQKKKQYVLQHEQIHFGLMEVLARQMTKKAKQNSDDIVIFGSSVKEVRDGLVKKIEEKIESNYQRIVAQHTAFDKDTSMFFDPDSQQKWYDKMVTELERLKNLSSP